jgi:hypothetical protein
MGLQIGIGLEDKFNIRVFTILKEVGYFNEKDNEYYGEVSLPKSLIAPNSYSFVFALWTRDGKVYDVINSVCPVMIHDNGTELALYEGIEYGNIIINPQWNTI